MNEPRWKTFSTSKGAKLEEELMVMFTKLEGRMCKFYYQFHSLSVCENMLIQLLFNFRKALFSSNSNITLSTSRVTLSCRSLAAKSVLDILQADRDVKYLASQLYSASA